MSAPAWTRSPVVRAAPSVGVCVTATAIASLPALVGGFPQGHDWIFELVRVAQYGAALAEGQWPPAWAPDLYGGYGSPIFVFYAPLYAAGATLLGSALGSVSAGGVAALVCALAIGAFSVQALVSGLEDGDPAARAGGRVAATFFVLHPYLIGNALLRNANAELLGLCLLPLPLVGVRLARTRPRLSFALVAIGLAGVVCAHNLTALVALGLLTVGAVVHLGPRGGLPLVRTGLALGAGLLLAAWFWIPAFFLTDLIRTEQLLTGKFDFRGQFPVWSALFGYDRFFAGGLLPAGAWLAAAAVAAATARQPVRERASLHACLLGSLALFGLMWSGSRPLWEVLPLLPYLQFPWRLSGPAALLTAIALGLGFARAGRTLAGRARVTLEGVVLSLCVLNALPHLLAYRPLPPEVQAGVQGALEPAALRARGHRATVRDEYLPRAAQPSAWRARSADSAVVSFGAGGRVRSEREEGSGIDLSFESRVAAEIELARFAFPGWRAEVDGRPAPIRPGSSGRLRVQLPATSGSPSTLRLRFDRPPLRGPGLVLSALGVLGILSALARRPAALWRSS